jgi:hypothetical protein
MKALPARNRVEAFAPGFLAAAAVLVAVEAGVLRFIEKKYRRNIADLLIGNLDSMAHGIALMQRDSPPARAGSPTSRGIWNSPPGCSTGVTSTLSLPAASPPKPPPATPRSKSPGAPPAHSRLAEAIRTAKSTLGFLRPKP